VYVPATMPQVAPYNIGQLYSEFAHAIRAGESRQPTFDTAVGLHHFIDALRQASDSGREVQVA
jgi:predicted dehydrogenase